MGEQILYEISDLRRWFGEKENQIQVLKGIDLSIRDGEIITILGPSGSGKSTLLNIIGGLDSPSGGTLKCKGRDISKMNRNELTEYRRKEIGFIFQFYNLLGSLNARENIESCRYLTDDPLNIDDLIETLDLQEHMHKFPRALSGGQQQRVAFARALIKNPSVLLCDEPTGALDYSMSKEILKVLERINQKYHTTIIIVTHNESIVDMSHHVIKIHDGSVARDWYNDTLKSAEEIEW